MPYPRLNRGEIAKLKRMINSPAYAGAATSATVNRPPDQTRNYVVYTDEELPAATEDDDGKWTPGTAKLPVYQFNNSDELIEVKDDNGQSVKYDIYNITKAVVPKEQLIIVHQERFTGRLVYEKPPGGLVLFELVEPVGEGEGSEEDCNCGEEGWKADVLYSSCGFPVDEQIIVHDRTGDILDGDEDDLKGGKGFAVQMTENSDEEEGCCCWVVIVFYPPGPSSGSSGSSYSTGSSYGSSGLPSGDGSTIYSDSSGSGASGSGGSSDGGGSGGGSGGSDKSTAIVPASWSPSGFTALFVSEAPEVRFDDVIIVDLPARTNRIPIDPKFLEVCEPGSVVVCSCQLNHPLTVGAKVAGGEVVARLNRKPARKLRAVIRLTGIRKGFAGHRFPDRTREQFEANERFIRSAYPGSERCGT